MNNIKTKVDKLKPYFNVPNLKIKVIKKGELGKNNLSICKISFLNLAILQAPNFDFELDEKQLDFIIAHELGHLEFSEGNLSMIEYLPINNKNKSKLFKSVINEAMCDIKAAQVTNINDTLIDLYFKNIEEHLGSYDISVGYLPYIDRAKYSKAFKEYNNKDNKIPIEKFYCYLYYSFKQGGQTLDKDDKVEILNIINNFYSSYFTN